MADRSGDNWEKGYDTANNVLLAEYKGIEDFQLTGKYMETPDGSKTLITGVEKAGNYLYIYTEEHLSDISIRTYRIVE